MEPFLDKAIAEATSHSDIDFKSFRKTPQTLSIINPVSSLGDPATTKVQQVVLESILSIFQDIENDGPVPVLIMIDELAQYPRMESVANAMSSLRKYDCTMSVCINDYGTLSHIYGDMADADFKETSQAFALN